MRKVALIREKILFAFERRDALFERRGLRVEFLDHRTTVILSRVEKDASQGRRNEGVIFFGDEGQVGRHDGERGTAYRACRSVGIAGAASVRFDASITTDVATRSNYGIAELVQTYRTVQGKSRTSGHGVEVL